MADHLAGLPVVKPPGHLLLNLATAAMVVTGLYVGREILVPFSLAVLLSFVLAPLVIFLQRLRLPSAVAVLSTVFIAFSIIFGLGGLMVSQASKLAADLPSYQQTLRDKIQSIRGLTAGSGTLEKASKVLKDLDTELQNPGATLQSNQSGPRDKPIPVELKQPDPGAFTTFVSIINPLIQPTTTTGIVLVFVIFILLQRQDLRNRFIKLVGAQDIRRTTSALDEAGERLSNLFLTQVIFNALFGLTIGVGLYFIEVPSAPLWGLIAMIMRFVPYIGGLITAIFPLILSAAVGAGWSMTLLTAGLFVGLELLAGQILEPLIYGHRSGLSPLAIILSASFWTWLWGPIGLVLATPLTVCLVVVGRHVDDLRFLNVLLGDQPVLTPPQMFYQRMLAGDPVEAAEQANTFLKTAALSEYYDDVVFAGLRLAEEDNRKGRIDVATRQRILGAVRDLVDSLEDHVDVTKSQEAETGTGLAKLDDKVDETVAPSAELSTDRAVLCLAAGGELDEAMAFAYAQMFRRYGFGVAFETADALSVSRVFALDLTEVRLVVMCCLDQSPARLQYAARRIHRKAPGLPIMICIPRAAGDAPLKIDIPNALILDDGIEKNIRVICIALPTIDRAA